MEGELFKPIKVILAILVKDDINNVINEQLRQFMSQSITNLYRNI